MKIRSVALFASIIILLLMGCAGQATSTPTFPSAKTSTLGGNSGTGAISTQASMPCIILHVPATPAALGTGFENRGHITGPADAPVTIIVFGDFQCPACAFLEGSLRQIREAHSKDVRLVFVNAPSSGKDKDTLAMQAAEASDLQGKYWEMHDLLFEKQTDWINLEPGQFEEWAIQQASGMGLNANQFKTDFEGSVVSERVKQASQAAGASTPVPPVLFVNSTSQYKGLADFASLDQVVRLEALAARQYGACPNWVIDPKKQYIVTLQTSKGEAKLQLFADKAPEAVNNFVFLAKAGWYDGVTFYRVTPNLTVQTGDPSETGMGNPGYLFPTESPAGLNFEKAGMVAMENSGANTNGSRFFVTLAPYPQLDGKYTIFGQVLSGLDVLTSLSARDPKPGVALPAGDQLIQVSVEER